MNVAIVRKDSLRKVLLKELHKENLLTTDN